MGLRKDQLADQIRDILAMNFQGGRLSDPRLEGVTITAVKLTADLQQATVFYRTYNDADGVPAMKGLTSAAGFLRKSLSEALDVRRVPELFFKYDKSIEYAGRIETVLDSIHKEKKDSQED
ncbi:MAG: 30S ribosome-binding factor RbfA [Proteobacteria bacterium]|jgi:ribosome-binding factor A|nr:MAG: 30S ribosome-binding factor RbfA [Pseudomonadota bacterium]